MSKPKKQRFTLVELLVVITIISILAGILLPVLGRTMESARRMQCLSNEKQIAIGVSAYTNDWNAWFPPSYNVPPYAYWYWQTLLAANKYIESCWPPEVAPGDYINAIPHGVYRCPSEKRSTYDGLSKWNSWKGCHYGLNTYIDYTPGVTNPDRQWFRINRVCRPFEVLLLGEKYGSFTSTTSSGGGLNTIVPAFARHGNGMHVVFVAGHAKWMSESDIPHEPDELDWYKKPFWGRKDCVNQW